MYSSCKRGATSSENEHGDVLAIPNSLATMLQDVHKDMSALTGTVKQLVQYTISKSKNIVSPLTGQTS